MATTRHRRDTRIFMFYFGLGTGAVSIHYQYKCTDVNVSLTESISRMCGISKQLVCL